MTGTAATAPTFAERRAQTLEHLRATIPADAARAAAAIAAAVPRLGRAGLIRAAVLVSELADLADEDQGHQRGDTTLNQPGTDRLVSPADCAPSRAEP